MMRSRAKTCSMRTEFSLDANRRTSLSLRTSSRDLARAALFWHFLNCDEYRTNLGVPQSWPPLSVDVEVSEAQLRELFRYTQAAWSRIGEEEPYWSVLGNDRFRRAEFDGYSGEFFQSGATTVAACQHTLDRNGRTFTAQGKCVELGCGVGRVTRWLAERFSELEALDISATHLAVAESYLAACGIENVNLRRLQNVEEFARLEVADFVFSVIVLQHNPPPVMAFLVRAMLGILKPGGLAYFQLPTYALGYQFSINRYLDSRADAGEIEMHVLPQYYVFRIVEECRCRVIEVREDSWVGLQGWISNTFLVEKIAATPVSPVSDGNGDT